MLTSLRIQNFRNLKQVSIECQTCNVFIGANGSGKTSLLESLHLLSRGKSFRHAQPKRYIQHHQPTTTVHAKFDDDTSMAIQKAQDASTQMRLSGQAVYVQSALAKQLPTLLIDPSSMDMLEVGSGIRRQLLDWIAFHVEPSFHPQWQAYQRLLKQRNTLLRQSRPLTVSQTQEINAWNKGLGYHAGLITHYREQVFLAWSQRFDRLIEQLLPAYAPFISLRFSAGYNTDIPFSELLEQRLAQDYHLGYTRVGAHRADIQILWIDDGTAAQVAVTSPEIDSHGYTRSEHVDSSLSVSKSNIVLDDKVASTISHPPVKTIREQAANVLSRGEKKLLITALRLSQLPLINKSSSGTEDKSDSSDLDGRDIKNTDLNKTLIDRADMNETIIDSYGMTHKPLILLDDIDAELDERALDIMLSTLAALPCQIFMTSLQTTIVDKLRKYWPNVSLFHVEQGNIKACNK